MNRTHIAIFLGLVSVGVIAGVLYTNKPVPNKKSLVSDITEYGFTTNGSTNPYASDADMLLLSFKPKSKDDMNSYFSYAAKAAQETSTVLLDGCNPFPATIHLRKGERVGFKNVSEMNVQVRIQDQIIDIKPGKSASTTALSWADENVLKRVVVYSCGEPKIIVGHVYITP